MTVTKIFMFEASHKLPHYDGDCHKLHGHSYKLEVTVGGQVCNDTNNPKCGMIIDFKDLKEIVDKEVISKYDHSYLNDFFPNPTAEIMVKQIALDITKKLPSGVHLVSCKLWETVSSYAEFNVIIDEMQRRLSELEITLNYADQPTLRPAT